jgi:VanZ family protein
MLATASRNPDMLSTLRHPRIWQVIGWLLIVAAVTLSLMPLPTLPSVSSGDKIAHAAVHAMLTLWFAGLYPRSRYVWIALYMFALGVCIELAQAAMRLGRQGDVFDVIANSVGIGAGLVLALVGLGDWVQRVEGWRRRL